MNRRKGFVLVLVLVFSIIAASLAGNFKRKSFVLGRLKSAFLQTRLLSNECLSLSTSMKNTISGLSPADQNLSEENFMNVKTEGDQQQEWSVSRQRKKSGVIVFELKNTRRPDIYCKNRVSIP